MKLIVELQLRIFEIVNSTNMGVWAVGTSNQLLIKGS